MASDKKLSKDDLTCQVCSNVFKSPVTLACGHTFCKECLITLAKSESEDAGKTSLLCKICGQLTPLQVSGSSLEEAIERLTPNEEIENSVKSIVKAPQEFVIEICCICKTKTGEKWCLKCEKAYCQTCLHWHDLMPTYQDHECRNITEIELQKPVEKCLTHPEQAVSVFCTECKMSICEKCLKQDHRDCQDVVQVEVITNKLKTHFLHQNANAKYRLSRADTVITKCKKEIERVSGMAQDAEKEIKFQWVKVIEHIQNKEKLQLDSLYQSVEVLISELTQHIHAKEEEKKKLQQHLSATDDTLSSNNLRSMYSLYEQQRKDESDSEQENTQESPSFAKIRLSTDFSLLSSAINETPTKAAYIVRGISDFESVPVLIKSYELQLSDDAEPPLPSSVLVLSFQEMPIIVVTDSRNKGIKYIDTTGSTVSKLALDTQPWAMVKVEETKIAVTFPNTKEIGFITFDPKPKLGRFIATVKRYYGLGYRQPSELVAGAYEGSYSVDILDLNGNILKSLSTGEVLNASFICVFNDNIVVSDWKVKSLVSVSYNGKHMSTYAPAGDMALQRPRGIAVTSTGDVLLADEAMGRIIHLTAAGRLNYVRDVITGLENPIALNVDHEDVLYVTKRDAVNVYDFKKDFVIKEEN